jgi:hypothetical protein
MATVIAQKTCTTLPRRCPAADGGGSRRLQASREIPVSEPLTDD